MREANNEKRGPDLQVEAHSCYTKITRVFLLVLKVFLLVLRPCTIITIVVQALDVS